MKISKLSLLAILPIVSILLTLVPPKTARAAALVDVSDNMSRLKTGVSSTHTFSFTLASTLGSTSRVRLTTSSFSFGSLTPTFTGNNSCAGTAGIFNGSSPFVSSITSVTSCDSGGCWDDRGDRYNGSGSTLFRSDGKICNQVGTMLSCN